MSWADTIPTPESSKPSMLTMVRRKITSKERYVQHRQAGYLSSHGLLCESSGSENEFCEITESPRGQVVY